MHASFDYGYNQSLLQFLIIFFYWSGTYSNHFLYEKSRFLEVSLYEIKMSPEAFNRSRNILAQKPQCNKYGTMAEARSLFIVVRSLVPLLVLKSSDLHRISNDQTYFAALRDS